MIEIKTPKEFHPQDYESEHARIVAELRSQDWNRDKLIEQLAHQSMHHSMWKRMSFDQGLVSREIGLRLNELFDALQNVELPELTSAIVARLWQWRS